MTQRIWLPIAGGDARALPFGDRKLIWSASPLLTPAQTDGALSKMTGRIPSNRYMFNRSVSAHPTETKIGVGPSTSYVGSYSVPEVICSLNIATPSGGTAGNATLHAQILAAIEAATGVNVLSTGAAYIGGDSVSANTGYFLGGGLNTNKGGGSISNWRYPMPGVLMEQILTKFKKRFTGELCFWVDDVAGTLALKRYIQGTNSVIAAPTQAAIDRAAVLGLAAPAASSYFGGSYALSDTFIHGSVVHGLHLGVTRIVLDGSRAKVIQLGGMCSMHEIATLLLEQQVVVPAYQTSDFGTFINSIYSGPNGYVQWLFYDQLVNPVDLWLDPDIAAALDSPFTDSDEVKATKVAGKPLSEWRDVILASPPRRLFYRGIQPKSAPLVKAVLVTLANGIYSFTYDGASITPVLGGIYRVQTLPAGDPEQHLDAIRRQTGAMMTLIDPLSAWGDEFRSSVAELSSLTTHKQWLYTVSASLGIKEMAQTLATLGSAHSQAEVRYI